MVSKLTNPLGARFRVFIEGEWHYGIIIGPNPIFMTTASSSEIDVLFDDGSSMSVRNDENCEQVMSPKEWSRQAFTHFCQDLVKGNIKVVDLAADFMREETNDPYAVINFCLDDSMATAFANALRQSTGVEVVEIKSHMVTELSLHGMHIFAQGVAGCSSLKHIRLYSMSSSAGDQSRTDILCQNLIANQAVSTLAFHNCFQPSAEAFQKLCGSHVARLSINGDFRSIASSPNILERDLFRFSSLNTIHLNNCPATVVESCLLGLVEHTTINEVLITNTRASTNDGDHSSNLVVVLDRFLESRAQRESLINLSWGGNRGVSCGALMDILGHYDVLHSLSLERHEYVDTTAALKIEFLLKSTLNLRKLKMPKCSEYCGYGEEGYRSILSGVRQNRSLHELSMATSCPDSPGSA